MRAMQQKMSSDDSETGREPPRGLAHSQLEQQTEGLSDASRCS